MPDARHPQNIVVDTQLDPRAFAPAKYEDGQHQVRNGRLNGIGYRDAYELTPSVHSKKWRSASSCALSNWEPA